MKKLGIILVIVIGLSGIKMLEGQVDSSFIESLEVELIHAELSTQMIRENFHLISSEMGGNILVFVGEAI